jgi:glucuronate isomerase
VGKIMNENFLLKNEIAISLFHDYVKEMSIIDYHCHLSPKEIYENKNS